MGTYKTVFQSEVAEIEVKKSKFIAEIRHISTEAEAEAVIKEIKKKYYDARHHCFAYLLRSDGGLRHSGDDGEPSGTAGKPILDVLSGAGVYDVIVVVTRYFGGTLLGTGGLVRAYSGATKEVLEAATILSIVEAELVELDMDYALLPKVVYLCKEMDITIYETEYLENVVVKVLLQEKDYGKFLKEITELSLGEIVEESIEKKQKVFYYMDKDGKVFLTS